MSPKILARAGSVVDPVKSCLTSSLITVQNLVAVSHAVCKYVGGPNIFGMLGALLLGMVGISDPLETCSSPHLLPY